jgi:hypothetical protein
MKIDYTIDISNLIVIVGGFIAFGKWIYEIVQNYKWERNKFLLEKLEDFRDKSVTKVMHQILDWNHSTVKINDSEFKVDDSLIISSLDLHSDRSVFKKEELLLRNTFDTYFDDLTNMVFMVRVGLIDEKHFRNFMDYWFRILKGEKSKPSVFKNKIKKYMDYYGYRELYNFIIEK